MANHVATKNTISCGIMFLLMAVNVPSMYAIVVTITYPCSLGRDCWLYSTSGYLAGLTRTDTGQASEQCHLTPGSLTLCAYQTVLQYVL